MQTTIAQLRAKRRTFSKSMALKANEHEFALPKPVVNLPMIIAPDSEPQVLNGKGVNFPDDIMPLLPSSAPDYTGKDGDYMPRWKITQLLNMLPHCVILFDLEKLRMSFVNDYAARLFGYESGELEAEHGVWQRNLYGEDQLEMVLSHIEKVKKLRDGETTELTCRCLGKSGAPVMIKFVAAIARRNKQGTATESISVGTVVDIFRNQALSNALRTAQVSGALFWEFETLPPRMQTLSGPVEQMTGFQLSEVCEGDLLRFICEEDRAKVASAVLSAVSRRTSFEFECRLQRKDGSIFWARTTGVWKSNDSIAGTTVDVTFRTMQRESLQRSATEGRIFSARVTEALEEEKRRHAQFLHDELGQLAIRVLMDIDWIKSRGGEDSQRRVHSLQASDVDELRKNVASLLDAIRGQSHELLPSVLEHNDLPAALEWLAQLYQRKLGIRCRVKTKMGSKPTSLSNEEIITLFRISQEVMTNIWKHAHASSVTVQLTESAEAVSLKIKDDGVGMPSGAAAPPSQTGLRSMKERANIIGATFSIRSEPARGTEVTVRLQRFPSTPPDSALEFI